MREILSLGAGWQSGCLFEMSCEGELPRLESAIFADTQYEPREVYNYLDYLVERGKSCGIPILVRTCGNLRADLLDFWRLRRSADGKRHASIPAFVKTEVPAGEVATMFGDVEVVAGYDKKGIVRRQCTSTYKIEVIEKTIREEVLGLKKGQHWPKPDAPLVRQWLGISADEAERMKRSSRPAVVMWHPLIEHLVSPVRRGLFGGGYTRQDCMDWIIRHNKRRPPRSACICCPFRTDAEWQEMKELRPDEFADACEVDRLIRQYDGERLAAKGGPHLVGQPYLHSSLIPLEMVQFDPAAEGYRNEGMRNECSGVCGV